MAGDLAELRALVEADTAGFMRGMDNVDRRMGKTQGAMSKMGAAGGSMARTVGKGALLMGGGLLIAGGFIAKAGLSMAMLKQNAQIAFTTMLGSGKKASAMMNNLQKFAQTTPFEFKELIPASQRLLAMGFAAKDVIPMLTDVGDAAAGLGLGSEGVNRITLALGQMQAKGKVAGGEMMQLTEAGIPAWKYLAEATGKSTAEVMKMSEKGLLPAGMAIKAIREGMRGDFGGMMAKQSKTLGGQLSNLSDAFNNTAGNIMGKFVPGLTKAADRMNKWLSGKSGQAFLQSLVDGAGAVASAIGSAVSFIVDHWDQIKTVGAAAFAAVGTAASTLAGVLGPIIGGALDAIQAHWDQISSGAQTAFGTAQQAAATLGGILTGSVIPAVQSFMGFLDSHQGTVEAVAGAILAMAAAYAVVSAAQAVATATTLAWASAMAVLDAVMAANPFVLVAVAIIGLIAAIVLLWKRNDAFRGAIISAWNAIKGAVGGAVGAVRGAVSAIAGAFSSVKGAVSGAVSSVLSTLGSLGGKVLSAIRTAFKIAWDPGPTLRKVGTAAVTGIISGMGSLASKAWSAIKKAFNSIGGSISFGVSFGFGSKTFGLGPLPDITVPYPNSISFGARGGVFGGAGGLAVIGEAGREFAIPVTRNRSGALALWAQAGKELGVPGMANGGVTGGTFQRIPADPTMASAKGNLKAMETVLADYTANTGRYRDAFALSGGTTTRAESAILAGRISTEQRMVAAIYNRRTALAKTLASLRRKAAHMPHTKANKGRRRQLAKQIAALQASLGAATSGHDLLQSGYDLENDRQQYLADANAPIPPPDTPPPADTGGGDSTPGVDAGSGVFSGTGGDTGGGGLGGGAGGGGGGPTYITIDMRGAVVTVDDFVGQVREKLAAYGKANGSIFGNVQADTVAR